MSDESPQLDCGMYYNEQSMIDYLTVACTTANNQ